MYKNKFKWETIVPCSWHGVCNNQNCQNNKRPRGKEKVFGFPDCSYNQKTGSNDGKAKK